MWKCATEDHLSNDDNKFKYIVKENGIYTILYSPSTAIAVAAEEDCDTTC